MADVTFPLEGPSAPMMRKMKLKQTIWPGPLAIQPKTAHTHSTPLLHGRGSNAERFGLDLLAAKSSPAKLLAEYLPSARFIFPAAKKRRSMVLKRLPINQWLENFNTENPSRRQHLQYDGIREEYVFVTRLVEQEVAVVGVEDIIIGGLST